MSTKILIMSAVVVYVVGYFCSYLFARYSGEDEGNSLGMSLLWPFLIVVYPLFCFIEKFSVLGRYFYCLGKKHRGEL
jgi:ABC-type xylose transport system permease subunit